MSLLSPKKESVTYISFKLRRLYWPSPKSITGSKFKICLIKTHLRIFTYCIQINCNRFIMMIKWFLFCIFWYDIVAYLSLLIKYKCQTHFKLVLQSFIIAVFQFLEVCFIAMLIKFYSWFKNIADGILNLSILAPINSSPKEQNGINEEGDIPPSLFRMWTGWLLTVIKSFLSVAFSFYPWYKNQCFKIFGNKFLLNKVSYTCLMRQTLFA